MRNITFVLAALLLLSGVSFAAEPKGISKTPKEQMITGIIEAIKMQPASGAARNELTVKKNDGKIAKFLMFNPDVVDANGKKLEIDQLKGGERVKVRFFKSKQGENEAKSIILN